MDEVEKKSARALASSLFNRVWELLEKSPRTPDEDVEMQNAAHASLYHWLKIGNAQNFSIGEWQLARVYTVLKRQDPALHHARRSLEWCEKGSLAPFYAAYSHEALARAYTLTNDAANVATHLAQARELAAAVKDEKEREWLLKDLSTIPS